MRTERPPVGCLVCVVTGRRVLTVQGREVVLEKTCGSLADCTFQQLCGSVSDPSGSFPIIPFTSLNPGCSSAIWF